MTEGRGRRAEGGRQRAEDGGSMESGRVKIICSVIGGLALLGAAFIGMAHHYFLKGEDEAIDKVVPVPLLEKRLGDANIYLSDDEAKRVREELLNDPAYQSLARGCLKVVNGKRLVLPVPLDNINGFYKKEMGVAADGYIGAYRYGDLKKLGRAIYEAWWEKQPGGAVGDVGEAGFDL